MWNEIYLKLMEFALKKLTDGTLVELAKKLVLNMMDEDIPNEEKHKNVVSDLKKFGGDFATTLLDIVVKVVYLVVRNNIAKLEGVTNED